MSKQRFAIQPGLSIIRDGKRLKPGATFTADDTDPQVRRWWRSGIVVPLQPKKKTTTKQKSEGGNG